MNPRSTIQYWGFFSREEITENRGKLLMLDIDFGRECSLNCPMCYRRLNPVDELSKDDLTYNQLLSVIEEAQTLGLRSIKICGAGEPTEERHFLHFVKDMTERGIGVACFTKGQVLGSDKETKRIYDVETALELCKMFFELKVSFMLGWQSFNPDIQDKVVGKRGHTPIRDQTLHNLIKVGFNKSQPTRLALCSNPITRENIDDVFKIYVYARKRNILPVTAALMVSGEQFRKPQFLAHHDVSDEEKLKLWTQIYSWNIKNCIQTLDEICEQGVSALPGIHPCNQVACGLYITANGNVTACPGSNFVEGNVKEMPLKEIWEKSKNRKRAGTFNCCCPPKDDITIPENLYNEVLKRLNERFGG